jgi:transposase
MYHAYGARTYRYLKTEYRGGAVYYHLEKKDQHRRCVECKSRDVTFDSLGEVTLKTVPSGGKQVFLVLHLRVLKCRKCGAKRQESRDVADPRRSYTRQFANYVLDLAKQMTILAVAQHLHVGWDLVKDIVKSNLRRKAKRRSWRKVRRIAIDEIALLYAREKLEKKKPEKLERLEELLAANETLHKVYLLKEELRLSFWSQPTKETARDFIEGWIAEAKSLDIKPLTTFAETIESRIDCILGWYDHPITTGPLEGLNNKIKVLKRVAYGYRDLEFFTLRLLFLHETKVEMAGA